MAAATDRCTVLELYRSQGRLAPAMAAPNVWFVAAASRTSLDVDKSTARSTAETSPSTMSTVSGAKSGLPGRR